MLASALKTFSSNILSNYSISTQPSSHSGIWKIYDGQRKSSAKKVSVFVFDRRSLDAPGNGLGARTGAPSLRVAQQDVVERLKREVSSLARLRHPSILELVEPVEETRNGGLMFATERVMTSLAALFDGLNNQDIHGEKMRKIDTGKDGINTVKAKVWDLDELEIQKGLLQVAKGLEFLHESAGLVHGNLTPDAIMITPVGDWKIGGMGFASPASDSTKPSSLSPIRLSEVLLHDPRLPQSVQLHLNYTSPDFVLDNKVTSAADMFSFGLLIIALYNSSHVSPIKCHGSLSACKKAFTSPSSMPLEHNKFLINQPVSDQLGSQLLAKLLTRRADQRLTAQTFQQSPYFDNILVSTLKFLDNFPTLTIDDKTQFLEGLANVLPQFPPSVLERKIMPVLVDSMQPREVLLPLLLQNIFVALKSCSAESLFLSEKLVPKLKECLSHPSITINKDVASQAALKVVLDNLQVLSNRSTPQLFRTDILPIYITCLSSSSAPLVDAALSNLSIMMPKLDYLSNKNQLLPEIIIVCTTTKSLTVKVQALEALHILCGATGDLDVDVDDGLTGSIMQHNRDKSEVVTLDRLTIQEKIVPLLKGIKTKEPAVMMAALKLLRRIGMVVDIDYAAREILPILWQFSLGPFLNIEQFQSFMKVIKNISTHIEREHSSKIQDSPMTIPRPASRPNHDGRTTSGLDTRDQVDFEALVKGRKDAATPDILLDTERTDTILQQQQDGSRASTSSLNSTFTPLAPMNAFNNPLQPKPFNNLTNNSENNPSRYQQHSPKSRDIDWSNATKPTNSSKSNINWIIPPPPSTSSIYNSTPTSVLDNDPLPLPRKDTFPSIAPHTLPKNNHTTTSQGLDGFESLI